MMHRDDIEFVLAGIRRRRAEAEQGIDDLPGIYDEDTIAGAFGAWLRKNYPELTETTRRNYFYAVRSYVKHAKDPFSKRELVRYLVEHPNYLHVSALKMFYKAKGRKWPLSEGDMERIRRARSQRAGKYKTRKDKILWDDWVRVLENWPTPEDFEEDAERDIRAAILHRHPEYIQNLRLVALLQLLTGWRAGDILRVTDVKVKPKYIYLATRKKGNVLAEVTLTPLGVEWYDRYFEEARDWLRTLNMQVPVLKQLYRLLTQGKDYYVAYNLYYGCVRKAAEKAGFNLATHDIRRSVVTTLLRRKVDPISVAAFVGHRHIGTTFRYVQEVKRSDALQEVKKALRGEM